jgi:hypothetical protein
MAAPVPTVEPTQARAGDTWTWARTLPDYPAPTWVLTYTVFSAAAVFTITATASGSDHLVYEAPADTDDLIAGRYDWVAHVTDGVDRHQVGGGSLTVLPDLADAASYDGRSHARKMLDAINAILEGRATAGDLDTVRIATDGRDLQSDTGALIKLRQQYAAAVAAEDQAARVARGEDSGRMLQVRFR